MPKTTAPAPKCSLDYCNNPTTNPNGRCQHHQRASMVISGSTSGMIPAPKLSTPKGPSAYRAESVEGSDLYSTNPDAARRLAAAGFSPYSVDNLIGAQHGCRITFVGTGDHGEEVRHEVVSVRPESEDDSRYVTIRSAHDAEETVKYDTEVWARLSDINRPHLPDPIAIDDSELIVDDPERADELARAGYRPYYAGDIEGQEGEGVLLWFDGIGGENSIELTGTDVDTHGATMFYSDTKNASTSEMSEVWVKFP